MPDKSIDFILCDLPYGVTEAKWDSVINFTELWKQYHRIIKENGAIVLFAIQPFTTKLIHSNLKYFRYMWYWKKNNATCSQFVKVQPMRCIEDICVFYKHKPQYNPQGLIKLERPKINKPNKQSKIYIWKGKESAQKYTNYPKNILEFNGVSTGRLHPTQKPVELLEYLVKTYTSEGDTVLDNCMGSGSTGEACINTKRNFIGIELDENYFNLAKNRLSA